MNGQYPQQQYPQQPQPQPQPPPQPDYGYDYGEEPPLISKPMIYAIIIGGIVLAIAFVLLIGSGSVSAEDYNICLTGYKQLEADCNAQFESMSRQVGEKASEAKGCLLNLTATIKDANDFENRARDYNKFWTLCKTEKEGLDSNIAYWEDKYTACDGVYTIACTDRNRYLADFQRCDGALESFTNIGSANEFSNCLYDLSSYDEFGTPTHIRGKLSDLNAFEAIGTLTKFSTCDTTLTQCNLDYTSSVALGNSYNSGLEDIYAFTQDFNITSIPDGNRLAVYELLTDINSMVHDLNGEIC